MEDQGRLSKHFWLTQGMARTIGVNVNEALRAGNLGRGEFAELVATCCHCDRTERCIPWLARQGAGAEGVPDWCPLKARLEALKEPA
ncbi:DUF6455 family protein [Rhodovulum euryhalinum]|uniref:DUF6455 domain-containing protein n=1 Tax=Rhodovulum euryhalinum TaxID=35805 RepID=A0A4R2KUR1_9RHOB|nr:DUF6455 family protein [Rhodovulum euryhalinum]TCO73928.1 hypothetical protein EV655_10184 [Rhodovulum euryhalinum]